MPLLGAIFSKKDKKPPSNASTSSSHSPATLKKPPPKTARTTLRGDNDVRSPTSPVDHDGDYVLPPLDSPSLINGLDNPFTQMITTSTDSLASSSQPRLPFRVRKSNLNDVQRPSFQTSRERSSSASSSLLPPPTRSSVFGMYQSDDAANSSRSTRSLPTSNAPPSPQPSRTHSSPPTAAHRSRSRPVSPLAQKSKDKHHGGLFGWVRDRKKSVGASSPDAPAQRSSLAEAPSGPSASHVFTDDIPTPTPTHSIPRERGFVPPIRPNTRAKLSTREEPPPPQESFNLKSFRHVRPGSPGPNAPISGLPRRSGESLTTNNGQGRPISPTPNSLNPPEAQARSRSRQNSFGSETSMTAGAFRQAMRRSTTNLQNLSPTADGPPSAASRSSGYLPLPVPTERDRRGSATNSMVTTTAESAITTRDKHNSASSAGSKMSFTDVPWATGRLYTDVPPVSAASRVTAFGKTGPNTATPPRPPRVNPPPSTGGKAGSPPKLGDPATPRRPSTAPSTLAKPSSPRTVPPLPKKFTASVSSTSDEEASSEEDSDDDAPLGLRKRANTNPSAPGHAVGRHSTVKRPTADEDPTVRGKDKNNSPLAKPDNERFVSYHQKQVQGHRRRTSVTFSDEGELGEDCYDYDRGPSPTRAPPRSGSVVPTSMSETNLLSSTSQMTVTTRTAMPRSSLSAVDLLSTGMAQQQTATSVSLNSSGSNTFPFHTNKSLPSRPRLSDSDSDEDEEESSDDDDDQPLAAVRRPGSALARLPLRAGGPKVGTRSDSGHGAALKRSSPASNAGDASRPPMKRRGSSGVSAPLVDLKAPSTMSPNSQPLPLPVVAKSKRPTLIGSVASTPLNGPPTPLKSSMRPTSRSVDSILQPPTFNMQTRKSSAAAVLASTASSTNTTPTTSIFSQPPSRPFARGWGGEYNSSPAGSSTGGSSSGKVPLTPRDGSELGGMRNSSNLGRGHERKGSVTFEEPSGRRGSTEDMDGARDKSSEEEKRKERRRSEARAAIQIGHALHGPLPDVDDSDNINVYPNMSSSHSSMNMMNMNMGMNMMGNWDAWSMAQQQQQQQLMMMSNPSLHNLAVGQSNSAMLPGPPISPAGNGQLPMLPPMPPPGTDPVAFMSAHHAAMLYAKQAYQLAVAQQAMVAAGEEWERSSNVGSVISGSGGGGYGGGFGMGMPMMFPPAPSSMYGGSSIGGASDWMGPRGPSSVFGGSNVGGGRLQYPQRSSASSLGDGMGAPPSSRSRTKSRPTPPQARSAPSSQGPVPSPLHSGFKPAAPPSSWRA